MLDRSTNALRLADVFDTRHDTLTTGAKAAQPDTNTCPVCKAPFLTGGNSCPQYSHELEQSSSTWALLRLWCFAQPYRWGLLTGFALLLIGTATTLVPPYLTVSLMGKVLTPYQNGQPVDYRLVTLYLSGLSDAALMAWVLGQTHTYLLTRVPECINANLRTTTYEHLLKLSFEYFGGKRTDDLMARVGSESDRISVFLSLHLFDFVTDVLMIAMTTVILVSIDPWLALMTLVPLPFIVWMIYLVRDRLRHGFEKIDRVWSEITNVLTDTIPGIRVVRTFTQERREVTHFAEANKRNLATNDRVDAVWSLFTPTVTLLTKVELLVMWIFGIWRVSRDAITAGVLVTFLTYISRFYTRLDPVNRIVSITQKAATGAKRIFDILDHVSGMPEPARSVHLEKVKGAIKLHDLGSRYGNRAVVRGLNLSIQSGEIIGLMRHSGSGEGVLVNLTCRLCDVSEDAIRLDGTDIRSLPVSEFRRDIGLMLQKPFLFFDTIADNTTYGKPDAAHEEVTTTARAAHVHEFILRLPYGYDSLVGERGQALSGDECRRISIAWALLINPRILIMDGAMSSMDTATKKEIQKALDDLVQSHTTIAITYRLSTLHKADRLVVMDRGQIVEIGNHDELLTREDAYCKLYQTQARDVDAEAGLTNDSEHMDTATPAYAQ